MKSVALIGMPGCGKTTIGKLLAKKMNFEFIDMDSYIEVSSKSTIKKLFELGEEHFRNQETKACRELAKKDRTVISTGGGVVKREENMRLLKENCTVVFIDRDIDDILSDIDYSSRPLLKDGRRENLQRLYNERYELYKKYCDFSVKNSSDISTAVEKTAEKLRLILNLNT